MALQAFALPRQHVFHRVVRPSSRHISVTAPRRTKKPLRDDSLTRFHYHFVGDGPAGLVKYEQAERLQDKYREKALQYKVLTLKERDSKSAPPPMVITFECEPTFTLGRRQADLSTEAEAILTQPLHVDLQDRASPIQGEFTPVVKQTKRGGLTTFHGPGQLVAWPVIDMHAVDTKKFSVASYAEYLQTITQNFLFDLFSIETYTIPDEPGVWVKPTSSPSTSSTPRKIAALGVHHRRYVTSLGVAINIDVPVQGPARVNPWTRFVPCGLEGKEVTSVAAELGQKSAQKWNMGLYAHHWAWLFNSNMKS